MAAEDTDAEPSSSPPPPLADTPAWPPPPRPRKTYDPIVMPSPEQMAADDQLNNCAVRTVLSCVMGGALGVAFGLFMGTVDPAGVSSVWEDGKGLWIKGRWGGGTLF